MRTAVWNNLANVRFKAFYAGRCSSFAGTLGRFYSFFLSFVSASSVAAWAIWKQYPCVWALIVGVGQLLHVAKPYIPFLGAEKDLLAMSFDLEKLYLEYERLWHRMESGDLSASDADGVFYKYREQEIEIERAHKANQCPELSWIVQKAQQDTDEAIARNFDTGEQA